MSRFESSIFQSDGRLFNYRDSTQIGCRCIECSNQFIEKAWEYRKGPYYGVHLTCRIELSIFLPR